MKGINNMISGLGPNKYITIISLLLAAFVIIYLGYNLTNDISEKARSQKKFVENIKDAKIPIEVTGNDVIPSKNGYQFTYSFWMFINNWEYNYGKLKHVFHKGNDNFTFASPGIWLHPEKNELIILMDSSQEENYFTKEAYTKLSGKPITVTNSDGEPGCLKKCIKTPACQSLTYNKIKDKCMLFKESNNNFQYTDQKTFHDNIMGGGWVLVRRAYDQWSSANDNVYNNMNSGSTYGTFKSDPQHPSNFSRKPPFKYYDQFLFASGEIDNKTGMPLSWAVIDKADIHNMRGRNVPVSVQGSHRNKNKTMVTMSNIRNNKSNPLVGAQNTNTKSGMRELLYGEASMDNGLEKQYTIFRNGGANVFVRQVDRNQVKKEQNKKYNSFFKDLNDNPYEDLIKRSICNLVFVPIQKYTHVVMTFYEKTMDIYIDGKLVRSNILDKPLTMNTDDLYINADGGFDGIMTNFKYFNRALSPEEIYIMYNKSYDDKISISNIPSLINVNNILNGILPD
tara:strand:- start:11 stop:1537 length:1527 start_codon:yes stop_codon:yes gene_type:complete